MARNDVECLVFVKNEEEMKKFKQKYEEYQKNGYLPK